MSEERLLILKMVAEGRLSPEEGNRLLAALEGGRTTSNGSGDAASEFFYRTAQEFQKGLEKLGSRASDELRKARERAREKLREQQKTLRAQLEEMIEKLGKQAAGPQKARDHTITIEIEDEDDEPETTDGPNPRTSESAEEGERRDGK